jgi:hypothetical protein
MSVVSVGPWSPPEAQTKAGLAALSRSPVKTVDDAERIAHLKTTQLESDGGRRFKKTRS